MDYQFRNACFSKINLRLYWVVQIPYQIIENEIFIRKVKEQKKVFLPQKLKQKDFYVNHDAENSRHHRAGNIYRRISQN